MNTSVSMETVFQSTINATQQIENQLTTLQAEASTGQAYGKVSDNPTASLAILSNSDLDSSLTANLTNIQSATTALNTSTSALQQANNILTQAKSIALQASSSTNDSASYTALAAQVNSLINNLMAIANTQNNGAYVFGGTATNTQPYAATLDAQGNVTSVQYQGSNAASSVIVGDNQQVGLYEPGNQIFQAQNRQAAVFTGSTGAQPGAGTDSATGQATLTLSHTLTTYAPGSGVQAGTSSAAGDTILGPAGAHTLTVIDTSGNGSAGTVSLDGGPPVAFTNADTNLLVTNSAGQSVYVNTTGISSNYNGTVNITSTGSMSIDGGTTSTPLTFAANQSVTDGATGAVTFVNTANVTGTGTESVQYPGTSTAFQSLINLRDALNNVNKLSSTAQISAISAQATELGNVDSQVMTSLGTQSATLQSLGSLQTQMQDVQTSTKATISNLSGADVANVVVQLQSYQQLLQLALESFSQISSTTLLNYLH
jgi:flagellar hook-associated protein 3